MKKLRLLVGLTAGVMAFGCFLFNAPDTLMNFSQKVYAANGKFAYDPSSGELTLCGKIESVEEMRYFLFSESAYDKQKSSTGKDGYAGYIFTVTSVVAEKGAVLPEDCSHLFDNFHECKKIDLSNADASNVADMSYMFDGCNTLTKLDVSNFDTSNVTDMSHMFDGCNTLTKLDVSNFNTKNVTTMFGMFNGCKNLAELDVSNFDTGNVVSMGYMFGECESLVKLDVSNFNTKNVKTMVRMFNGCKNLAELDVSNFDTSNVVSIEKMFSNSNLKKLSLGSGFDISDMEHDMKEDFGQVSKNLKVISCSEGTSYETFYYARGLSWAVRWLDSNYYSMTDERVKSEYNELGEIINDYTNCIYRYEENGKDKVHACTFYYWTPTDVACIERRYFCCEDSDDLQAEMKYMLALPDLDKNGIINAVDVTLLKRILLINKK